MHSMRTLAALSSAVMSASLAGCASAPSFAAQNVCRQLRNAAAGYESSDISPFAYASMLQQVARDAQKAPEPDMIASGASLEAATSGGLDRVVMFRFASLTQAADRVDDACDGLGI